jgi:hypothetical protein
MDQQEFRRRRKEIADTQYSDGDPHNIVQAILLLAEIANEQCEELKLTRLAVEEETHRYDGDKF